ncbi:teichoic acid transport system permease protein [Naumannella cuiyingiana]|uniref:Teichoic acid transport system permease protein n=1 Tax=Naumannella cuiyingiana TaxID=1347891 RepID=A0A7Z0D9H1_9ACTN|nr:ABC transporter permease [Naumannella cuiyingiana]NYI71444.1 teichoic acid transport system permease protein [Naumannella cuiyingiana]
MPEADIVRPDLATDPPRRSAGAAPILLPVGGRPPLGVYIAQLIQRWPFALAQARAQTITANGRMLLGNLWLILQPLLDALMYYLIFQVILGVSRGIPNYVGYLLIGVFMFGYTGRAMNQSAGIVSSNKGLIRAFAFPRAALLIGLAARNLFSTIPTLIVLLVILILKPPQAYPTPLWLLFPAVIAIQTVFNLGLSFIVARITDAIPDLRKIIGFVTRLWLFVSCVMFGPERVLRLPYGEIILNINPAFQVLDISRKLLIYDTMPEPRSWIILAAWSVVLFLIGFVYFWRGEVNYGRA